MKNNPMCKQRCEFCSNFEQTDENKGFCAEYAEEVLESEGEFCEEFNGD